MAPVVYSRIALLPALISLTVSLSCSPASEPKSAVQVPADTTGVIRTPVYTAARHTRTPEADSILAQIIRYYKGVYGNDSSVMQTFDADSLVELRFSESTAGGGAGQILLLANIPVLRDRKPGLRGDLNGDGLEDLFIGVPTEGGGGGGNVYWADHFVFLADGQGNYTLADTQGDSELIDGPGYFSPESITNGVISGTSNEYAEDDGHCCPSLYYRVMLRLQNGKLIQIAKASTAKPVENE